MKLTTSKISDVFDAMTGYSMTYTTTGDSPETITLVSNDAVKNFFIKYADWSFIHLDNISAGVALKGYWDFFCAQKSLSMYRAYLALTEEYNPLHNYDKNSSITSEDILHTDKQINPTVKTTNSGGTTTNTRAVIPNDDTQFADKEKDTTVVPQTTTSIDPYTVSLEYGATKNTVTEHTAGNIGVTTSAQMLSGELEVRKNNLIEYILTQFVKEYLFLNTTV